MPGTPGLMMDRSVLPALALNFCSKAYQHDSTAAPVLSSFSSCLVQRFQDDSERNLSPRSDITASVSSTLYEG